MTENTSRGRGSLSPRGEPSDEVVEAVARAICGSHLSGYCAFVGGDLGCRVGRGESFNGSNCIATRDALVVSEERSIALAAIRAYQNATSVNPRGKANPISNTPNNDLP